MTKVYYETQNEHSYAFCIIILIINKDFFLLNFIILRLEIVLHKDTPLLFPCIVTL